MFPNSSHANLMLGIMKKSHMAWVRGCKACAPSAVMTGLSDKPHNSTYLVLFAKFTSVALRFVVFTALMPCRGTYERGETVIIGTAAAAALL